MENDKPNYQWLLLVIMFLLIVISVQLGKLSSLIQEGNSNSHWITEFLDTNLLK